MKRPKFKFDPNNKTFQNAYRFMEDEDELSLCDKPEEIPLSAIREGTFYIRRNGFLYPYEYWIEKNWWMKGGKIEKGFWLKTKFNLFPSLPTTEWLRIKKCKRYLTKEWRDNLWAWEHWKELRNLSRDTKLFFLKMNKK